MLSLDLIPWWIKAAVLAAIIGAVFSSGVYFESLRWAKSASRLELAAKQQTIDQLKKNLTIISTVTKVDSVQAIADAKSIEELERIANEVAAKTADGQCLNYDDTNRLRNLWK